MPPGRVFWHSKVDVAFDQLHEYPQRYRNNPSQIAVDECMTEATGWPPDTYKIPSKSVGQGFKFHRLADYGFGWKGLGNGQRRRV